jgi:hypothetical protein
MYYRDPDCWNIEYPARNAPPQPKAKPLNLAERLILSAGLSIAPVGLFFLALGIGEVFFKL